MAHRLGLRVRHPEGTQQAIHLPGDSLSEKGYLFVRFFYGAQDSYPALLWSLSSEEYVVRKFPQHSDYITSAEAMTENGEARLNRTEVQLSGLLSKKRLGPRLLHSRNCEGGSTHMTLQYCNGGTATAYYQSLTQQDERKAFMWLFLATAVRAFAYLHHGVTLPDPLSEGGLDLSNVGAKKKWDPILHCDAHTTNFFVHFASSTSPPKILIADFSRSRFQPEEPGQVTNDLAVRDDFRAFLLSIGTFPPLKGGLPPSALAEIQKLVCELDGGKSILDLVKDGSYSELIEKYKNMDMRLTNPHKVAEMPIRVRGESRIDKLRWRDPTRELDEMSINWSWLKLK